MDSCAGISGGCTARHARYVRLCTLSDSAGALSLCRRCPLVKWGGGAQVLSASCAGQEPILTLSARGGLGPAPFGALCESAAERLPGRPQRRCRPLWPPASRTGDCDAARDKPERRRVRSRWLLPIRPASNIPPVIRRTTVGRLSPKRVCSLLGGQLHRMRRDGDGFSSRRAPYAPMLLPQGSRYSAADG